jgi:hypothetical protein
VRRVLRSHHSKSAYFPKSLSHAVRIIYAYKIVRKYQRLTQKHTVEYRHLSAAAEREVFQRVQLGVSLTTAEKLQAISSPWANYITHLEKTHVTIDGGLVDQIAFDDTRGRAFQNVAQFVYCCAGLPAAQRVPTAVKLEKWLIAPDERPSAAFQDAMGAVLSRLWELARSEELDAPFRRFKAKIAPVEFVFIGACAGTQHTHIPCSSVLFVVGRRFALRHAPWVHCPRTVTRGVHTPARHPQDAHRRAL